MKTKTNLRYLWLGITLFVIGVILSIYCSTKGIANPQSGKVDALFSLYPILAYIVILVITPCVEEFAFRGWSIKKNWIRYCSYVAAMIFLLLINKLLAVAAAIIFIIIILIKNHDVQRHLSFIASSVIFALAHIESFGNIDCLFASMIAQLTGLAFVFAWLATRYNIWVPMIAHALYNLTVTLLTLIPIHITCDTSDLEVSSYHSSSYISINEEDDRIIFEGPIAGIATSMMVEQQRLDSIETEYYGTVYLQAYESLAPRYRVKVTPRELDNNINYHNVLKQLAEHKILGIDTTYDWAWFLSFPEEDEPIKYGNGVDLKDIILYLRINFQLPVFVETDSNPYVTLALDRDQLDDCTTVEECIELIHNRCGLELRKSTIQKAQIIIFR